MDTTQPLEAGDFVDPADEDWSTKDDAECWHAAQAGIPQAIAELARRASPQNFA
ncbi:MAG TPA: hypothetical protein VIJ96_09615 [Acidothermaceae bacterium]